MASVVSIATLLGCGGDGQSNRVKLTKRLGCSPSYVAKRTDALGVEETGNCVFRGCRGFDRGVRRQRCSQQLRLLDLWYNADTEVEAVESAARGLGSRVIAVDRYLVGVPDSATEQAAREALR